MNTIRFQSTLNKFSHVKKHDDVYWQMQLKIIEDSSIRTFIPQFNGDIDFNGAFDHCAVNDVWTKMIIPLTDYKLNYVVQYNDIIIDAQLISIAAIRKETKPTGDDPGGIWQTEYTLTFTCDPDKDMIKNLILYEKRKEEDLETGKKVLKQYPTVLSEPEEETT